MNLDTAIFRTMLEICKCKETDMLFLLKECQFGIIKKIQFLMEDCE